MGWILALSLCRANEVVPGYYVIFNAFNSHMYRICGHMYIQACLRLRNRPFYKSASSSESSSQALALAKAFAWLMTITAVGWVFGFFFGCFSVSFSVDFWVWLVLSFPCFLFSLLFDSL